MVDRIIQFTAKNSFFLFGARGTGKTHLLKEQYTGDSNWYIDLLNPDLARKYLMQPTVLVQELAKLDFNSMVVNEFAFSGKL